MAEENPIEGLVGFNPDKAEEYKNNLKLAILYNDSLQWLEQNHFLRVLDDDERIELALRFLNNKIQLAIHFNPTILIFKTYDLSSCLIPLRVKNLSSRTFSNEDGLVYTYNLVNGRLALSISNEDFAKIMPTGAFGPNNPFHIELILRNEEEKIHCFSEVKEIVMLPPSEKTGKYLLSLNAP